MLFYISFCLIFPDITFSCSPGEPQHQPKQPQLDTAVGRPGGRTDECWGHRRAPQAREPRHQQTQQQPRLPTGRVQAVHAGVHRLRVSGQRVRLDAAPSQAPHSPQPPAGDLRALWAPHRRPGGARGHHQSQGKGRLVWRPLSVGFNVSYFNVTSYCSVTSYCRYISCYSNTCYCSVNSNCIFILLGLLIIIYNCYSYIHFMCLCHSFLWNNLNHLDVIFHSETSLKMLIL